MVTQWQHFYNLYFAAPHFSMYIYSDKSLSISRHLQDSLLAKMKELDHKFGVDAKDALTLARKKAFDMTRDSEAEEKENNPNW